MPQECTKISLMKSDEKLGIFWIIIAGLAGVLIASIIRVLASKGLPLVNIFAIGDISGFVALLAFSLYRRNITRPTGRPVIYVMRAVFGIAAGMCWVYAIANLPLSLLSAIEFSTPIFASMLAIIFLGEKMTMSAGVMLIAGSIGVWIAVGPELEGASLGVIAALGNAVFWSCVHITLQYMTRSDSEHSITLYSLGLMAAMLTPLLVIYWQPISGDMLPWVVIMAVFMNIGLFALSRAHRLASVVTLMPFEFTYLIFATIAGYAFFSEEISMTTIIGGVVILLSTIYGLSRGAVK